MSDHQPEMPRAKAIAPQTVHTGLEELVAHGEVDQGRRSDQDEGAEQAEGEALLPGGKGHRMPCAVLPLGGVASIARAADHAATYISIVKVKAAAVRHPDQFSVNGQRSGVEGAGTNDHCVTGVLWKEKRNPFR